MKRVNSAPEESFCIGAEAFQTIEVEIRQILNLYHKDLSENAIDLLKNLGYNFYSLNYKPLPRVSCYDPHSRAVWLLNMMSTCTHLMNDEINENNRHVFYKLITEVQKLGGCNLANTTVSPHPATCIALNLTTHYVYEADFFADEFAKMTLAYIRTYCKPNSKIFVVNDIRTNVYRMGATENTKLMNWKHIEGGMNGFMAIKYYLSEHLRAQFRSKYSSFYKSRMGYTPSVDQLRECAFVPTCKLKKLEFNYNDKPIYGLTIS
jgi:hypothetical protein